jgi:hypothetical protein
MSWALLADEQESVPVTGTVLNLGTMQEALEVIFALREVRAVVPTGAVLYSLSLRRPPCKSLLFLRL